MVIEHVNASADRMPGDETESEDTFQVGRASIRACGTPVPLP